MVAPLYFLFPEFEELLDDYNLQSSFLLGKSLMVAPAFSDHY